MNILRQKRVKNRCTRHNYHSPLVAQSFRHATVSADAINISRRADLACGGASVGWPGVPLGGNYPHSLESYCPLRLSLSRSVHFSTSPAVLSYFPFPCNWIGRSFLTAVGVILVTNAPQTSAVSEMPTDRLTDGQTERQT